MYKILVVEDECRLLEAISDYLSAKTFDVCGAKDGKEALEYLENKSFDLLLLDVMIPHMDGFAVCKTVRKKSDVPIIFITARCSEGDQLHGFALGADDYIIKPFSLPVLYAKCKAIIERNKGANKESIIRCGGIEINLTQYKVFVKGKEVILPMKEFEMLLYMVENKNQVLTRGQILNRIWGYDYYGDSRVVDTHIKRLRKALGLAAKYIKTVIKVGYQFTEGEEK